MIRAIGTTIIQNTWDRLSKEKVIFAAIAVITLYALYKTYNSLIGRIEKFNTNLSKTEKELEDLKKTTEQIEKTNKAKSSSQRMEASETDVENCSSDEDSSTVWYDANDQDVKPVKDTSEV
jgi:uncharacterized protein YjcR